MKLRILFFLLLLVAGCTAVSGAPTAVPPTATSSPSPTPSPVPSPTPTAPPAGTVSLQPVVTEGLFKPLYLTHAGDERLFIVQQHGVIGIVQDDVLRSRPFLDIQERVLADGHEQGLLSLAFHPQYAAAGAAGNGRFYVAYTAEDAFFDSRVVISQFQVDPNNRNRALPDSEKILLVARQPAANHNGGQLQFGPDGYLYIGLGDGGGAGDPEGNGQNRFTLPGSLLRIDVNPADASYTIPPGNPNDAEQGGEVWAFGLRNPWRFSFDRDTGDLYVGDVGQSNWEEVSMLPTAAAAGANFGWNVIEGTHCYSRANCSLVGTVTPIYEYSHKEGCSVTGGYVYRGEAIPTLQGTYIFGDYCHAEVWALTQKVDDTWTTETLASISGLISSFGEDVNGELYVVSHVGAVYRIVPAGVR